MIGAALALWADSATDARREVAEEIQYLEALEQDFFENQRELTAHVETAARIRDANLGLLDTDYASASRESVRLLLEDAFRIEHFRPVLATYHDMVNSGDIRLLRSDSLRVALARFESQVAVQGNVSQWAWDHWIGFEEPLMIEARALTGLYPEYEGIAVPPVEYRVDLRRLAASDFADVVTSRVWIQQDLVQGGQRLLDEAATILRLIAESRPAGE